MLGWTIDENQQRIVELDEIIIDRRFQVRNRTDAQTVKTYTSAMQAGSEFPPVTLAEIDGRLFLIDGFHRFDAATSIGRQGIEAVVVPMTEREALKTSAVANLTHGLRLTKTEKLNAFKQFIKGGGHLKERGKLKSYREIASELHGIGTHGTVRNWMVKHFPRIAHQMGDDKPGNRRADVPEMNPERERAKAIRDALGEARTLLGLVSDPEEVYHIREMVEALMMEIRRKEAQQPDF